MRRKLTFAALTIALFLAGFAVASFPALAELRTITITLVGGQQIVTTVDVPPGTSPDQIRLPEVSAPIESIQEAPAPSPGSSEKPKSRDSEGSDDSAPGSRKKKKDKSGDEPGEFLDGANPQPEPEPREKAKPGDIRTPDGTPTADNPTLTLGAPGPAPVGVPNFVIRKFRIPPFLLPIYQAAGTQYGIRWEVLAAINEIETDYGRNLNVSSAGALGWMQFIPSSWRAYGTDANADGEKDPYNPVDAIFAAARYLKAAGAEQDLRRAIFAYNHADWYVDSVMLRARMIAGLPADLVGSLTGLTQAHFPVYAKARYADDVSERDIARLSRKTRKAHNASAVVDSRGSRRSVNIYSRRKAPVIAVNDGVVKRIGENDRLGRFVVLQDVYGNRFTYAHLGSVSKRYAVPKDTSATAVRDEFRSARAAAQKPLPKPKQPASAGTQRTGVQASTAGAPKAAAPAPRPSAAPSAAKERLFANPTRPRSRPIAEGTGQLSNSRFETFRVYFSKALRLEPSQVKLRQFRKGARVAAGTVLGRVGKLDSGPGAKLAPHLNFSIRPAGRGAPRIDPKPILDGWKLLEATAIYRAAGKNPFAAGNAGQVLLMSKEVLARRALADPDVDIYDCGREDVRTGQIDRRVLATLEFLATSGLKPTVTSLKCGHSFYSKAGSVSEHSSGNAVDIAAVNGTPILGNQGRGSITEDTIRKLLTLQGPMQPHQIISLMDMGGPTMVLGDHADHIHVGFQPLFGTNERLGRVARRVLSNNQWDRFVSRLTDIENPVVRTKPSKYSIKVRKRKRASHAHVGE